jgi:23S rRNA (uracil1939-C5)-methyltransferase
VVARLLRRRPDYAEAETLEVLRRSPDRVEPACEHYGLCGGCDLQHLGIAAQRAARRVQVAEILKRIGGVVEPPVAETLSAGEPWAYRFRMDFDWRPGPRGRPIVGLHRRRRPEEVVEIRRCLLMSQAALAVLTGLSRIVGQARVTAWDPRRRRGLLRRASILEAGTTREILVVLETGRGEDAALSAIAQRLLRAAPRLVGIVRRTVDRSGVPAGSEILAGRGEIEEEVEDDRLTVPAEAFFQPNRLGCVTLRRTVLEALAASDRERVLELYGGVGFFTIPLARRAAEVTMLEGSFAAAAAARANLARAGIGNGRVVSAEVSEGIGPLLREDGWDAALLDPPRVGLAPATARALAGSGIPRLVYVSCDPATLARDLRLLGTEYRVERVTPIDLFPQTRHVECVAALRSRRT